MPLPASRPVAARRPSPAPRGVHQGPRYRPARRSLRRTAPPRRAPVTAGHRVHQRSGQTLVVAAVGRHHRHDQPLIGHRGAVCTLYPACTAPSESASAALPDRSATPKGRPCASPLLRGASSRAPLSPGAADRARARLGHLGLGLARRAFLGCPPTLRRRCRIAGHLRRSRSTRSAACRSIRSSRPPRVNDRDAAGERTLVPSTAISSSSTKSSDTSAVTPPVNSRSNSSDHPHPEIRKPVIVDRHTPRQPAIRYVPAHQTVQLARGTHPFQGGIEPQCQQYLRIGRRTPGLALA